MKWGRPHEGGEHRLLGLSRQPQRTPRSSWLLAPQGKEGGTQVRDIANGSFTLPGSLTSDLPLKVATSGCRSICNCSSAIVLVRTTLDQASLLTELLDRAGQCLTGLTTLSNVFRLFLKALYKAS